MGRRLVEEAGRKDEDLLLSRQRWYSDSQRSAATAVILCISMAPLPLEQGLKDPIWFKIHRCSEGVAVATMQT